jgi:hypothetical protein
MQFSLKDLLVVVAFVAVISWCVGQIGLDNASLWIVLIAMAGTGAAFISAARRQEGRWLAPLMPVMLFVPCFLGVISPAVSLLAALLFLGGVVFLTLGRPSARVVSAFVMVCMAASLVVDAREVRGRVQKLEALRREFPIVSLVGRLDYERPDEQDDSERADEPINVELLGRLDAFEEDLEKNNHRSWDLQAIHNRQHEKFIRSMGFGVLRMRTIRPESIQRPPLRDIAFAETPIPRPKRFDDWSSMLWADDSNTVYRLHEVSRNDFFDPNGFGGVVEPKRAAGFIEHAMHISPRQGLEDRDAWLIDRLELVSLLKFDEPRVYVLDHLPRMDQLSSDDVLTRALDEFEKESLEKLRTEEDLVVREEDGVHRMLGSLRAAKQCLECHSVDRGELLGAFSYVLRRGEKGEVGAAAGQ